MKKQSKRLMKLAKTFEEFQLNEGIKQDIKKFIKRNEPELNRMADEDEWEAIYQLMYSEFDVEAESDKAKDLKQTFDFIF